MRRIIATAAVAAIVLVSAGCSSSQDEAPSPTAVAATPSQAASDSSGVEAAIWAGDVCTQMARVKTSVSALGGNLSYDITADRSALDQIQRQLTIQVLALGDAADALQQSLAAVPVDFVAANDMIVALTKTGGDTRSALDQVGQHITAATEAGNLLSAAAELGQALIAAKAAFTAGQAFVGAIGDATSTANSDLRAAFDAAPECTAL